MDTIFALSSGRPPAGIAVIRISGPRAFEVDQLFTGRFAVPLRLARLVKLRHPQSAEILDEVLTLRFSGPASATGENIVEWHCHGGRAVVRAVLDALSELGDDIREAEAGEFTRRAFENGRIDLNEAEGLADLLEAETEDQRRSALMLAEGHFSRRIEAWKSDLLQVSALVETILDFSDEDDVGSDAAQLKSVRRDLHKIIGEVEGALCLPSAERLRDGIRVVIAGPPNAGKSTLLNAMVGRDAAITSDIAGTTRDRIEVPMALGDHAFLLTDTAGLRDDSLDVIEAIGMERSRIALDAADILLWLGKRADAPRTDAIVIGAQSDRRPAAETSEADLCLSALTGDGMAELFSMLQDRAAEFAPAQGEHALHHRQREGVNTILRELVAALKETDPLILAEYLRSACRQVDLLTGKAGVEDMLKTLFGRFCIGK